MGRACGHGTGSPSDGNKRLSHRGTERAMKQETRLLTVPGTQDGSTGQLRLSPGATNPGPSRGEIWDGVSVGKVGNPCLASMPRA